MSTTLECDDNRRNAGQPDYGLPAEPITEEPLDQAARFVNGTGTRRDYPDVEIVLAEQQPTAQIIALVSNDESIGILRYENDDALGWHLTSTEQCSPTRSRNKHSARFDKPGIKTEVDPPAPSIQFSTTNAWMGWYRGDYVAVYAGNAGYRRTKIGSVIVFTYDDHRSTPLGYTRTIPGSGALRVVAIAKPIVELEDRSGTRLELNLDTSTLH